jgi:hypothetical protein
MGSQYQTEDGCKEYNAPGELKVTTKNGLVVIEKLGISAKALRINSMPVALKDGELYCSCDKVKHVPHAYKAGEIEVIRK